MSSAIDKQKIRASIGAIKGTPPGENSKFRALEKSARLSGSKNPALTAEEIYRKKNLANKDPEVDKLPETDIKNSDEKSIVTPSQHPFPVFTLCPPVYADTAIKNNAWMAKEKEPIDKDKFLAQWYNLYNVLAGNSMVYLITPVKGLQDQVYVNCYAYLPHIKDRDVIILSNFTAEGRTGEEDVAGKLFLDLGYEVFNCPFKFEGEPELKYLHDDIYIGGWGFRTDPQAHKWLEENYGAKIILLQETDEKLYHLDCSVFPITAKDTLICTDLVDQKTLREIEKVTNVISVSKSAAHQGICNSLSVEGCIYNASALPFMHKTDAEYQTELEKNQELEKICTDLGQDLLYFDLSECAKSGAALSCFISHLNYRT